MNRRGFLGIFGAGVAAGPKLAAGIAEGVASSMPAAPIGGYAASEMVKEDTGWRLKRIANLKRIMSGKDPEVQQRKVMYRLDAAETRERVRLDGLRSVSPSHKHRMLTDGHFDRHQRIRRADAGFELARFLRGEN